MLEALAFSSVHGAEARHPSFREPAGEGIDGGVKSEDRAWRTLRLSSCSGYSELVLFDSLSVSRQMSPLAGAVSPKPAGLRTASITWGFRQVRSEDSAGLLRGWHVCSPRPRHVGAARGP